PLAAWLALWMGLKVRSQMKAILAALCTIATWLIVPTVVVTLTDLLGVSAEGPLRKVLLLNPSAMIPAVESAGRVILDPATSSYRRVPPPPWALMAANLLLHGGALWALRRHVLQRADRLLGRVGDETPPTLERPQTEPSRAPVHQMAT